MKILPFPKAVSRSNRQKRRGKTIILTDTLEKNVIEGFVNNESYEKKKIAKREGSNLKKWRAEEK